jgi:hypothetical protein
LCAQAKSQETGSSVVRGETTEQWKVIQQATSTKNTVRTPAINTIVLQTNLIICGITPFDVDHICVFGYVPPIDASTTGPERFDNVYLPVNNCLSILQPTHKTRAQICSVFMCIRLYDAVCFALCLREVIPSAGVVCLRPELQLVARGRGEVVYADALPLKDYENSVPQNYKMHTTYKLRQHRNSFRRFCATRIECMKAFRYRHSSFSRSHFAVRIQVAPQRYYQLTGRHERTGTKAVHRNSKGECNY